ncbi:MAG: hypothetical protein QXP91_13150 [Candidatus Methanomethylicia archaeon]
MVDFQDAFKDNDVVRVLQLFSIDELNELYEKFGGVGAINARDQLINNLGRYGIKDLMDNEWFRGKLVSKVIELIRIVTASMETLSMKRLKGIAKSLNVKVSKKDDRSRIIENILKNHSLIDVLEIIGLESISSQLIFNAVMNNINKINSQLRVISSINENYKDISRKIDEVLSTIRLSVRRIEPESIPMDKYLNSLISNLPLNIPMDELDDRIRKVTSELGIDVKTFIEKGLQLVVIYGLWSLMKGERFKLLYQTFYRILDEEYGKVKDDFGRAEISELRRRICSKLGISEETFNEYLLKAYSKEDILFVSGAPIGYEGKPALIVNGKGYHYITLKR